MSATVYFENGRPIRGFSGLGDAFDAGSDAGSPTVGALGTVTGAAIGLTALSLASTGIFGYGLYHVFKGHKALGWTAIITSFGVGFAGMNLLEVKR